MSGLLHDAAGLALVFAGWLIPRRIAGARRVSFATMLDAAPLGFVAMVLFLASGR